MLRKDSLFEDSKNFYMDFRHQESIISNKEKYMDAFAIDDSELERRGMFQFYHSYIRFWKIIDNSIYLKICRS